MRKQLYAKCKQAENAIFNVGAGNVGAGEEYTIREFVEIICNIINYPHENIIYDTEKYVGAKSRCLNIDKVKNMLTIMI